MISDRISVAFSSPAPPPDFRRRTPIPPVIRETTQDDRACVGDDVADAEPCGLVDLVGEIVPALFGVDPLGADSHEEPARQRDRQESPVPEPERSRIAARVDERARARDDAAYEDHRPEDVDEEREVLGVGSNCGEEPGHAPGFQIMSMRISSTTTVAAAWNQTPFEVRFSASSSAFGPVWPAA